MSARFTARIIKGGALLADTRRFLEAWDPDLSPQANLKRITEQAQLGKTQVRQRDVLAILRRRFVEAGPVVIRALQSLLRDRVAFREACYYEAARTDALLAKFASGPLYAWYSEGRRVVDVEDVGRWLDHDKCVPQWGAYTRKRVARGLISALRDFGLLEGPVRSPRKRILAPHLSMLGFLYIALRERDLRGSSRAILQSGVWRWYLLTPEMVRRLFLEADRLGYLRFMEAGSIARIDWLLKGLEEFAHVSAS